MTDKTKAIFILILAAAFMLGLILAGCTPFPSAVQLDRCEYQIIPAPAELPIPALDGEIDAKKGDFLCLL
jgi:hypothetical protein